MQQWKPIPGFEIFEVSNQGNVRRLKAYLVAGRTIKTIQPIEVKKHIVRDYYYADLRVGGIRWNARICRLVALCFIGPPKPKNHVNHKDGNKLNDKVKNLEWCTPKENAQHASKLGLIKPVYGELAGNSKWATDDILEVFKLRSQGYTHRQIATIKGMGVSTVTHILLGTRWPHLKEKAIKLYEQTN